MQTETNTFRFLRMLDPLDNYFFSKPEPLQSCLLYLRQFILSYNNNFSEQYKFKIPFYYFKNKWCCYLSISKKTQQIYIGFVQGHQLQHPKLLGEGRKQIKVFYVDPEKDIDIKSLKQILNLCVKLK